MSARRAEEADAEGHRLAAPANLVRLLCSEASIIIEYFDIHVPIFQLKYCIYYKHLSCKTGYNEGVNQK